MIGDLFREFSVRKLWQLTERIEVCLGRLTEEQIWARGSESENAAGNLVLHLTGNLGQWIVSGVGGAPDSRQRDAEFNARGGDALLEGLRARIVQVTAIIEATSDERLAEIIHVQKYEVSVLEAIYHAVEHFAQHAGQIMFATKLMTQTELGFYSHLKNPAHEETTP